MAKTNDSNLKLPELFANMAFRIPRYQRGYAWGKKQWEDLWDDIMEIEKDNDGEYRRHYTGTIALKEISQNEKWNQYTILERGRRMVHFLETMVSGLKFSDEEIMALLFVKKDYYVKES